MEFLLIHRDTQTGIEFAHKFTQPSDAMAIEYASRLVSIFDGPRFAEWLLYASDRIVSVFELERSCVVKAQHA